MLASEEFCHRHLNSPEVPCRNRQPRAAPTLEGKRGSAVPNLRRCPAVGAQRGLPLIGLPAPSRCGTTPGPVVVATADPDPDLEFWIDQGWRALFHTGDSATTVCNP